MKLNKVKHLIKGINLRAPAVAKIGMYSLYKIIIQPNLPYNKKLSLLHEQLNLLCSIIVG